MKDAIEPIEFKALDDCHRQIQQALQALAEMAGRMAEVGVDEQVAQQAATLEAFFSGTSRQHHAEEEAKVFPPLLAGTDPVLVAAVRTLKQDHGWIEQNWSEISPQLLAIARGYQGTDPAELAHAIEVFHELCADHIALEESLVYPEAKALHAKALARRAARLTATP